MGRNHHSAVTMSPSPSDRNNPTENHLRTSEWTVYLEMAYLYIVPTYEISDTENVHLTAFIYVSRAIWLWRAADCALLA
jgi:hypothetical protein